MFAVLILYDIIREANVKIAADMWARNTHGAKKEKRRVYGYFICASTLYSGNMNLLVNTIQASLKQIFFFFLSMTILNIGRKNIYVQMHMCMYMNRKSDIQKCK